MGSRIKIFGYVADNPFLYESLTGYEYITFLSQLWEVSYPEEIVSDLLERFQIKEVYDKRITDYSFGMKKISHYRRFSTSTQMFNS